MSDQTREDLLHRLAKCDTQTLAGFAALADRIGAERQAPRSSDYLRYLTPVANSDVRGLINAEKSYGISWKLRGGVDTYHMLRRKWVRVEKCTSEAVSPQGSSPGASPYDVFEHIAANPQPNGILDDIRDLRRYLMLCEAEICARTPAGSTDSDRGFLAHLQPIANDDVHTIHEKEKAYGDSWRRNGGIGAFMIFARKWDRIVQRVTADISPANGHPGASRDNILEHIAADHRSEPILEDIRDLRQFLLLTEAEMAARGIVEVGTARDDREK
jgi:hypothetical protein